MLTRKENNKEIKILQKYIIARTFFSSQAVIMFSVFTLYWIYKGIWLIVLVNLFMISLYIRRYHKEVLPYISIRKRLELYNSFDIKKVS